MKQQQTEIPYMEQLTWQDTFNTGIDVIDDQHRQLLDYLNKLGLARQSKDLSLIKSVIEDLSEYTISHFAFEEALMEEAGYPYARAHKSVHQTFIKRVTTFTEKFEAGEDIVEEFYGLLKRWLINHIQRDDMAYAPAIKNHIGLLEQESAPASPEEPKGSWVSRAIKKFFK